MFHVELRQFPHQARAFNLEREDLERRVLRPWVSGAPVELQDRRFTPEKAKLVVYESRRLEPSEIGLGRGWANVTRLGSDVTAQVLGESRASSGSALDGLLAALAARGGALTLAEALATAAEHGSSEGAEQDIWRLLHNGRLVLEVARAEEP